MNTSGVMRGIGWTVAVLVGLVLLAYLAMVIINWKDEPPSADVERLVAMNHDRPVLADGANGYVHAMDLAAGPDADYRAARTTGVSALATECGEAPACLVALDEDSGALAHWLDSEQWLLERYRRMLATDGWREVIPESFASQLPAYQPMMDAQKLHLLDAWRLADAGEPAAVRDLLQRDLVFWRQVLASSDLLITKMIAAAAVRQNFALGNLALRELPPDLVDTAVPPSWRQPLTVAERSLARPLGGEWHLLAGTMRAGMLPGAAGTVSRQDIGDRLARPLLQEQATLNLSAARMVRLATLSELPHAELSAGFERFAQQEQSQSRFHLYNPVGTMLDSVAGASAYTDYIARMSDLEGVRRATLLVASLRGDGVGPEGTAAALRDASIRSPHDDAPFEWDAASGSLVFDGLERSGRGRHAVLF